MNKEEKALVDFARHALHGLHQSQMFVGVVGECKKNTPQWYSFLMQVGHCVMNDKLIVIPVARGTEVPKKLAAIADKIVWFNPDDPPSLQAALVQAFTEMGINKQ